MKTRSTLPPGWRPCIVAGGRPSPPARPTTPEEIILEACEARKRKQIIAEKLLAQQKWQQATALIERLKSQIGDDFCSAADLEPQVIGGLPYVVGKIGQSQLKLWEGDYGKLNAEIEDLGPHRTFGIDLRRIPDEVREDFLCRLGRELGLCEEEGPF